MQLNKFQTQFKNEMFSSDEDEKIGEFFVTGEVALDDRLSIYRNNIMGSLEAVMTDNFPLIANLVGEEFMGGMARRFITQSPPDGGCLNNYGSEFSDFIQNFEPAKSLPYLPDIARYEWAKHRAYYAVDDLPLVPNDLAAIAPEELGDLALKLRDGVHLIASPYPLTAIRDFSENPEGTLDLDQGGVYVLIHRPDLNVEVLEIDEASFAMLLALQEGNALGAALELTLSTHPDFDIQAFLQTQLSFETFLAFNTKTQTE